MVNGITTQNNWSKTMNEELKTLKKTIDKTTTDVINRLHHLKGMDRYYLLMEHFETLIFNWDDYEVDWIEQIKLKEKPVIKQKKEE